MIAVVKSALSRLLRWVDAHPLLAVFGVALFLRLLAVALLPNVAYDQGGDAVRYLSIATDIVDGLPYGLTARDYTRVPLYQLFLALHLWLFGDHLISIAISQALLGAATAVVLTWIADALLPDRRTWVVGMLWATYPSAIINVVTVFPQTLQVFWFALSFWLLVTGVFRRSTTRCAGAAFCWGLACLSRSGYLLFLPIFALGAFLLRPAGRRRWRWALAASAVMVVTGMMTVVWWTARDFTQTYRLEYLFLNGHERNAAALVLRPVEPLHAQLAETLRRWAPRFQYKFGIPGIPMLSHFRPEQLDPEAREVAIDDAVRNTVSESHRFTAKLWQALGAPDGCVQLGCTGIPGGYWAVFRANVTSHPFRLATIALGEPCMALKVAMYVHHYLLLLVLVPAFVALFRRSAGVATLFLGFTAYTMAAIVFASNYSPTVAAVPRFAFPLMPIFMLIVGLMLLGSRRIPACEFS